MLPEVATEEDAAAKGSTTDNPRRPLHITGLILARGGSQSVRLKNMADLGGRPLLQWSMGAMKAFGLFDSLWVSTDHPAIAECALEYGFSVFHRSSLNAQSRSPSVHSIQEFLTARPEVDVVGLIQCTCPFLRPEFLQEAFDLILEEQCDSVFSVTRDKKLRWDESSLIMKDLNSELTSGGKAGAKAINFDPRHRPRRQDFKGELIENGMFHFARRHLIEDGLLQGGRCACVQVPQVLSVDIDSSLDFAFAEQTRLHEQLVPFEPSKGTNQGLQKSLQ